MLVVVILSRVFTMLVVVILSRVFATFMVNSVSIVNRIKTPYAKC